jgi:Predicted membrane protein
MLGIVSGVGLCEATGEVGDFGITHRYMNYLATHLKPGNSPLFVPLKNEAFD